jgi:DNA-binding transcriptional regulator YhcF (GntR family)
VNLRLRIDPRSDSPIYRQISEQIANMIEAGTLRRGEHLPPERELALQLKIARGTVKKAYESLVQQRYIVAARGKGSTVAGCNKGQAGESLIYAEEAVHGGRGGELLSDGSALQGSAVTEKVSRNPLSSAVYSSDQTDFSGVAAAFSTINEALPHQGAQQNRHDQAAQMLSGAIIKVEELGFSYRQISDLFGLMLSQREEQVARFAIAAVDCNPEALGIYQRQLAMLTHMSTARFLLSALHASTSADAILAPFDLILTTSNHVDELRQLAPGAAGKVVPVIVAPTRETLIALARLENGSRAGVLFQSARFFAIIKGWLQRSGFQGEAAGLDTFSVSEGDFEGFVAERSVLIVPPGFASQLSSAQLHALNAFRQRGGQLIDFEYQIERGSLLHLEELIKSLLNKSRN